MKISVVIPTFNEEKDILKVLDKLQNFIKPEDIIIIDDCSLDNTYNLIKNFNPNLKILKHDINLGKGAALKTGCEAAIKLGADIIVCIDADDQHDPADISRLVEKINAGNDIVFGSRKIGKGMPLVKFLGNKFLSVVINKLFKIYINDTQSGFRAFTADAYQKIKWESREYDVEAEMIVKTAENNLKFDEIEIATVYHDDYKGTTPLNGLQIFFKILKWKFL